MVNGCFGQEFLYEVQRLQISYDGNDNRVMKTDVEGYQAGMERRTFCVGEGYEKQYTGVPDYEGEPPLPPVGNMDRLYLPLIWQNHSNGMELKYYFVAGKRVTVRINGELSWLYGDQLGSVSAVAKADGTLISRSLYYPWGSERLTQGTSPTDYGYTGQMQVGDIYYYNARWYDPMIGRFMQADTIVPPHQGTQVFDRYAYVNNNPLRYFDPSGNWLITGWNDEYLMNQGDTNKCAIYSLAMGVSVIYGTKVDVDRLDNGWLWTEQGIDWGVPPKLQPSGVNPIYRNVRASYETGGKADIISLLGQDLPVVVTFAFPLWGHSVLAIGYEPDTNELVFADPATGTVRYENEFLESTKSAIHRKYPWTDTSKYRYALKNSYNTVDSFLQQTDLLGFVPPRSLTVLRQSTIYHGGGRILLPPISGPGGRGTFRELF